MANTTARHVIFGTGPVGMGMLDELMGKQKGTDISIRMVNRSGKTSEPLPAGVELVNGDVGDKNFAATAAEGAAVIYNALNPPAYHQWAEMIMPLWEGVTHAATSNGARLVSVDNLYMYGDTDGEPIHEELPFSAHTKKGKIRAQATHYMMDAHGKNGTEVVIAHASDYVGPRVYGSVLGGDLAILPAIHGKAVTVLGNPDMPHTYTYVPDVARALVTLALDDTAYGQRWHIPSLPAISTRRYVEQIFAAAGNTPRIQNPPNIAVRVLGWFAATIGEMIEMMYEFEKPFVIDSTKFEQKYGWGATSFEQAIDETVAWFKANSNA